jgi:O-antigen ligase
LIVALLPFLVVILQRNRNSLVRLLLLASVGIGLATTVLTGSRASMISLLLVLFCYIVQSRHKVTLFIACAILAVTVWVAMPEEYRQRYLSVEQYIGGAKLDDSNKDRLKIWRGGWAIFLEHPLLGVGAGEFQDAFHAYSGEPHGAYRSAHNLVVEVGCELGIVGLIVFGYFVSQITKNVLLLRRLQLNEEFGLNYRVAQGCGMMLLALVVMSCVGHTLFRPYWYLLGGLVAANRSIVDRGLPEGDTPPITEEETAKNRAEPNLAALFEEGRSR